MIRAVRTSSGLFGAVVAALLLVAVCVKAMIPAGYMLGPATDGPALVLCTAQGAVTIDADGKTIHPGENDAPGVDHQPCPFAAIAMDVPPPSDRAVETVTFAAFTAETPAPAPAVSPGRGLAAPPLPARGPPSLTA